VHNCAGGRKRRRLVRVATYKQDESEVECRVEKAVSSDRIRGHVMEKGGKLTKSEREMDK
jgi:hypothetical protein